MRYQVTRANYLLLGLLTFSIFWSGLKSYFSHMVDIAGLSTNEIIQLYADILDELKDREVIRTNNLVGDLGEYIAVEHFNNNSTLPNLIFAPEGTRNIDALSRNGERYSIKATTTNLTGIVYDINHPDSEDDQLQKFEYMLIVQLSKSYKLKRIIQLEWNLFLKYKKWHSTMRGWNISITKTLLKESKVITDLI
jgi:hypothetical protein